MELVQTEHFWEENKEQLHESEQSINLCPRTWYKVLNIYLLRKCNVLIDGKNKVKSDYLYV